VITSPIGFSTLAITTDYFLYGLVIEFMTRAYHSD
jgi:hypothetical protein